MNDEAYYLLLKKLKKIYDRDRVKVFGTTVFDGFKCLSLKEEAALSDTLFINKGCFGKSNAHKMLIHFSGDYISQLFKRPGENDYSLLDDYDNIDFYVKHQADFESKYTKCYDLLANGDKEKLEEELNAKYNNQRQELEAKFSSVSLKDFVDDLDKNESFKAVCQYIEDSKKNENVNSNKSFKATQI